MKNVIILGSGRSGTSLVAGCLAKAGYFMGQELLAANDSNPKGFYEDVEVNAVNEALLKDVARSRLPLIGNLLQKHIPLDSQRWLLALNSHPVFKHPDSSVKSRMLKLVANKPFCFKDPRFSYTLPVWMPVLENTVFVVVFRDPARTAASIVKECREDSRLHSLRVDTSRALAVWTAMYSNILSLSIDRGQVLYFHYDQAFTSEGLGKLANFTGATIDMSFPDRELSRSKGSATVDGQAQEIYARLIEKSDE